jgi:hypothetical protein
MYPRKDCPVVSGVFAAGSATSSRAADFHKCTVGATLLSVGGCSALRTGTAGPRNARGGSQSTGAVSKTLGKMPRVFESAGAFSKAPPLFVFYDLMGAVGAWGRGQVSTGGSRRAQECLGRPRFLGRPGVFWGARISGAPRVLFHAARRWYSWAPPRAPLVHVPRARDALRLAKSPRFRAEGPYHKAPPPTGPPGPQAPTIRQG